MVGRARGGAAPRRLLSCRVLTAVTDRRHRLPQQTGHLRSAASSLGRDDAEDRRRSQTARRQDRYHVSAAHLGLDDDAPSACAHDRAGRWPVTGRQALGCSSAQVPAAGEGALAPVQETHARGAGKSTRGNRAALLQAVRDALRETGILCLPQTTTSIEVGGLCQGTIRWARARLLLRRLLSVLVVAVVCRRQRNLNKS